MAVDTNPDLILQKLLKDGKYYDMAFSHYYAKYAISFNHRLWLILILSYIIVLIVTVVLNIYLLFPLKLKIPFVQYTDSAYEDIPHIKSMYSAFSWLNSENEGVKTLVPKYLLQNYIMIREVDSDKNEDYKELYIKNNSSYKVYNEYLRYLSANPSLEKSNKINKRTVLNIIDIKIIETNTLVKRAIASYKITDLDNNTSFKGSIRIDFRISDLLLVHKGLAPLEFMVVDYEKV